jgi:hypothetical protein
VLHACMTFSLNLWCNYCAYLGGAAACISIAYLLTRLLNSSLCPERTTHPRQYELPFIVLVTLAHLLLMLNTAVA